MARLTRKEKKAQRRALEQTLAENRANRMGSMSLVPTAKVVVTGLEDTHGSGKPGHGYAKSAAVGGAQALAKAGPTPQVPATMQQQQQRYGHYSYPDKYTPTEAKPFVPRPPPVHPDKAKAIQYEKDNGPSDAVNDPTIRDYLKMLTFCTPAYSKTEQLFFDTYVKPIATVVDKYGNGWVNVLTPDGQRSNIAWSSHTDTVHHGDGFQVPEVHGPMVFPQSGRNCLGADDKSGVWLMLQMIEAKVPGLYIFHRDEEVGGKGSSWIRTNAPMCLSGIDFCIAFDRKAYGSVITEQSCGMCASDAFAVQMSDLLGEVDYRGLYRADDTGTFTDTANYTGLVAECSNLSVGYFNAHGPGEHQDLEYLQALRDKMVTIDWSQLIAVRKPGEQKPRSYDYGSAYGGGAARYHGYGQAWDDEKWGDYKSSDKKDNKPAVDETPGIVVTDDVEDMVMFVKDNIYAVAQFLVDNAVSEDEIVDHWYTVADEDEEEDDSVADEETGNLPPDEEVDPDALFDQVPDTELALRSLDEDEIAAYIDDQSYTPPAQLREVANEHDSTLREVAQAIDDQQKRDLYDQQQRDLDADPDTEAAIIFGDGRSLH